MQRLKISLLALLLMGCGDPDTNITIVENIPPPTEIEVIDDTARLSWEAPTQNTDDSCVNDLDGYNIYYGQSSDALNNLIVNAEATCINTNLSAGTGCGTIWICEYTIYSLMPGTWYFAVTAFDLTQNESDKSNIANKTIHE